MEPREIVQAAIDAYHDHDRIALGPYVIDEERATGFSPSGPDMARAILVYRLAGDLVCENLILP